MTSSDKDSVPTLKKNEDLFATVTDPETGEERKIFAFKSDGEIYHLQSIMNMVEVMPISQEKFADRYGAYPEENVKDIEAVLGLFKQFGALADKVGTSKRLAKEMADGTLNETDAVPDFLLGEMYMISRLIGQSSARVSRTFKALKKVFLKRRGSSERKELLEEAFNGKKGLTTYARRTQGQINSMINDRIKPLIVAFEEAQTAAEAKIKPDEGILSAALEALEDLNEEILKDAKEIARYDKKYKVAASVTGVGTPVAMALTGPLMIFPLAAGCLAGAFWAEPAKQARSDARTKMLEDTQEQARKMLLVADLVPLSSFLSVAIMLVEAIQQSLEDMGLFWLQVENDLAKIIETSSLSSEGEVIGLLDANDARIRAAFGIVAKEWAEINEAAQDFIQHAALATIAQKDEAA